MSNVISEVCSK